MERRIAAPVRWLHGAGFPVVLALAGCGTAWNEEPEPYGGNGGGGPSSPPEFGPLLTADCAALGVDLGRVGGDVGDVGDEGCCGCLCANSRWSCGEETCTDADGQVRELAAEAGYIEVPGGEYTSLGAVRVSPTQRVFYSFHPADDAPEERPLAVFFNGGPGAATTAGLLAMNTAPFTLDPAHTGDVDIIENEHSFTRAYNVLYIDAPGTGFSYTLPLDSGEAPPDVLDMDRDAGVFNHVLLFFLRHHEALADGPVILVGESYGTIRAVQMVRQLLTPESLLDDGSAYGDAALYCTLQAHFVERGLLSASQPASSELDVTDLAEQFGYLTLVQHYLLGTQQKRYSVFAMDACQPEGAPHQCDESTEYMEALDAELVRRLLVPDNLERMLGTNPASIAWLEPGQRSPAYAVTGESDVYVSWRRLERAEDTRHYWELDSLVEFVRLLPYLKKVLLTAAERDLVVDAHSLVRFVSEHLTVSEHPDLPRGAERPGVVSLELSGGVVSELRMPRYENAGHMVTLRAPGEFYDDVRAWMEL